MFGARVSLLILFLSSFYQDLETKDVKCDIGAPAMEGFTYYEFTKTEKPFRFTTLTNSKIFTDGICYFADNFYSDTFKAATRPNSFGEKRRQEVLVGFRKTYFKNGKLIMDYKPTPKINIFTVLSGNYTVLATDNSFYLILGACLESFEKPFIRVLTRGRHLDEHREKDLRKELKSLGFDESKFMRINRTICPSVSHD
ncbi:uncharacterized protein [Periplaneta americana]|uniref:uncharacterized protein n=1 Tax=Periplaneta americana TaxID=6978 RepID=UPI0037E748DD